MTDSLINRRVSEAFYVNNMRLKPITDRPDLDALDLQESDVVYLLKDLFTTTNGSWEEGTVPEWARESYLTPKFLEAGAPHHLLAAIIDQDGELIKSHEVIFWSDGFDRLGDPSYTGYLSDNTQENSGWANMPMARGSIYYPTEGQIGPWCWMPEGPAEVLCGGGLPERNVISIFAVWQAVDRREWEEATSGKPDPDEPDPDEPDTDEPDIDEPDTDNGGDDDDDPLVLKPAGKIQRRQSEWISVYNIEIKSLEERPDKPTDNVIYLVKDIFTTRNGSWEPSPLPGSIPHWAREEYLKPVDAPDYFNDAGGDHHLFAAVIGLDGKMIRQHEIRFWSDGYEMIGDPGYTAIIKRKSKADSGWANIMVGPGSSFVPERGESGPWCWAPAGASEVVCGGGLPLNHHISTFVVWQATTRDGNDKRDEDDIYLPIITGEDSQYPGA